MKKLLLATLVFFFAETAQLFSANPIPSYNIKVNTSANFQEMSDDCQGNQATKERRLMNIQTSTSSPTNNMLSINSIVYVYKLNGNKILGPFVVGCGEILSVEIDNNKWGTYITLENPETTILASVWIGSHAITQSSIQTNTLLLDIQKRSFVSSYLTIK
jgi:hypothetical protein